MNKEEAGKLFKALGDKSRLKIVKILYHNDEICACKLLEAVNCNQSTLSHHMRVLVDSNLLYARKEGKWVRYSCNKQLVDSLMNFIKTTCPCTEVK